MAKCGGNPVSHPVADNFSVTTPSSLTGVSNTIIQNPDGVVANVRAYAQAGGIIASISGFDAADLTTQIDVSGGSLFPSGGVAVIQLIGSSGVLAEDQVPDGIAGNTLYLADPASVNAWVNQHINGADAVSVSANVSILQAAGSSGVNVTSKVYYDGLYLGGSSGSVSAPVKIGTGPKCRPGLKCQPV